MSKRGHFVESADGKLYAYANVNFPHGPSQIHVFESATGSLLADVNIAQAAGPLVFTEEGLATREEPGKLELRIPLPMKAGPDGPVFAPPDVVPRH
jgi:hypothetical protein